MTPSWSVKCPECQRPFTSWNSELAYAAMIRHQLRDH